MSDRRGNLPANRQVSPAGIGDGWAGLRARAPPAVRGQVRAHRFSAASVSTAPPKPARWAVLAHGGDRGSEESCTPPSHGRQQGCAVSIHPRLVTSVPHLVWSRPLAGRPISEESPGVMPRPAHGLHETGPIYREAGRPIVLSIRRSLVERDGADTRYAHLGFWCRERRPTSATGTPSQPASTDTPRGAPRATGTPSIGLPARRTSRSRRADERTPGERTTRATMRQIGTAARGRTRAGIPTPRRASSRPATPRP